MRTHPKTTGRRPLALIALLLFCHTLISQNEFLTAALSDDLYPIQQETVVLDGWQYDSEVFSSFSAAFDRALLEYDPHSLLAAHCCDDYNQLPPVGAIIGGNIRAGFEHLKYSIWRNYQILFKNKTEADIPYRRYFVDENEWTGEFSVAYKEYAVEPALPGRLLDNSLAGLDLAAVVPSTQSVTTMMAKTPGVFTVNMIREVTARFDNLKCVECADAIIANLKRAGISGKLLQYQTLDEAGNPISRFIISHAQEMVGQLNAISRSGMHRGVLVEGKVYDNIHRSGIDYELWIRDLESTAPNFKVSILQEF